MVHTVESWRGVAQLDNWTQTSAYHTCVIEDSGADGAVLEHCVGGDDIFKVAVFEEWVLKLYWLHLNTDEPITMEHRQTSKNHLNMQNQTLTGQSKMATRYTHKHKL